MTQPELHPNVPPGDPAGLPPRPRRRQQMNGSSLMVIGIVAFIFGVALHVYVVKAVLNSGGGDNGSPAAEQIIVSTSTVQPSVAAATVTPTTSPQGDRSSCEAIRGTAYRSEKEHQFFLANCLTPTP
ncbi:MAG TPA: hypothetical protein VFY10_00835 [Dehalococcoidia bacterium]|nr:hypothetical protein [Dehalococcoidia bacterium]